MHESLSELRELIDESVREMSPTELRFWELAKVDPTKWRLEPWSERTNGFWAVGIVGRTVIWYNEIEGGFNTSQYSSPGVIDEYWCDQSELVHVIHTLLDQIETGNQQARAGPPEPVDMSNGA